MTDVCALSNDIQLSAVGLQEPDLIGWMASAYSWTPPQSGAASPVLPAVSVACIGPALALATHSTTMPQVFCGQTSRSTLVSAAASPQASPAPPWMPHLSPMVVPPQAAMPRRNMSLPGTPALSSRQQMSPPAAQSPGQPYAVASTDTLHSMGGCSSTYRLLPPHTKRGISIIPPAGEAPSVAAVAHATVAAVAQSLPRSEQSATHRFHEGCVSPPVPVHCSTALHGGPGTEMVPTVVFAGKMAPWPGPSMSVMPLAQLGSSLHQKGWKWDP